MPNARTVLPPLWETHRGYAISAFALFQMHLWAVLDEVLPGSSVRHNLAVFEIYIAILPGFAWACLHGVVAFCMIFSMYGKTRSLLGLRLGCAVSMSVFTVMGISLFVAAIKNYPMASFLGPGFCTFIILSCVAMVQEPAENPANVRG